VGRGLARKPKAKICRIDELDRLTKSRSIRRVPGASTAADRESLSCCDARIAAVRASPEHAPVMLAGVAAARTRRRAVAVRAAATLV